jgi:carboxyl-terminal processing protease
LAKHLNNPQDKLLSPQAKQQQGEKRPEPSSKTESLPQKPVPEAKRIEYGSDTDFQLSQALNYLQGKPVQASKTLKERTPEDSSSEDSE